ncbi:MAG: glycosyltransferase family 2 protein [Actinomycetota bacterium]|nr:glycosyltransferase family 2 protein [Actinomycetota bacterium]
MLRALARSAQVLLLGLVAYNALTALAGWANPPPAPAGSRGRRLRVVVPAHDEEGVIERVLADLAAQDYPSDLVSLWVVADRCSDRTALLGGRWASVVERREGPEGKGAALRWYLEGHPLHEDESLVVLDADNRVPASFLGRLADELDAGHAVLQAYLDVDNPDASAMATASALSYWASNRMVQLARRNLGWSADLGGTGMCLSSAALAAAGGFGSSVTEDQELNARLVLAGIPVTWLHDVRVRDEKPAGLGVAVRQRARWRSGWREVAASYVPRLVGYGIGTPSAAALDLAIRLLQPSRTLVALVSLVLAVLAAVRPGRVLLSWRLWAGATAAQVVLPLVFLVREGVPARYLVRYPLLTLLALLWLPVRVLSRAKRAGWYHTPHGSS